MKFVISEHPILFTPLMVSVLKPFMKFHPDEFGNYGTGFNHTTNFDERCFRILCIC